MFPILGIMASQISGHLTAPSDYESIATVTVGTAVSSITFSSIAADWKHLQIRGIGHWSGTANTYANGQVQLNGDTGSNYAYHRLYGNGSAASADASTSTTKMNTPWFPDDTYSNTFGSIIIDILDYSSTNKYKTIRSLGGFDGNGSGLVGLFSGLWMNTAAVTSFTISLPSYNLTTYSQLALYGIKG
tara:strand:+ start:288 stop:851 length:564 start_codon:yes stop_codon:yes gene_type:complete